MARSVLDGSLQVRIQRTEDNGVAAEEMAEILTYAAFCAGLPQAWAASSMAKDV